MRLEFFAVPARDPGDAATELNQFLASHRVCSVIRELIGDGPNSFWSICVEWTPGRVASAPADKKGRIDYREILSAEDFAVFAKLRDLRKGLSEKDGVPPYALFTNEHLAEMVRQRVGALSDLQKLEGVGPAKIEKYGKAFLEILRIEFAGDPAEAAVLPPGVSP